MDNNNSTTNQRREFLKKAGVLIGAGTAFASLSSLIMSCQDETIPLPPPPPPGSNYEIDLTKYPALVAVGGVSKVTAVLNSDSTKKAIYFVKKTGDSSYLILQSTCTHQSDQDLPDPVNATTPLVCPRHQAAFTLEDTKEGTVFADPKSVGATPLKKYDHTYDSANNKLVIKN